MAREYAELYNGDIQKLRDGLDVLDRVVSSIDGLDIWLYGVVTNPTILAVSKGAIIQYDEASFDEFDNPTLDESHVEVSEIGVYIRVSPDVLDMLMGSGYPIADLPFVYQEGEGEGVRTLFFSDSESVGSSDKIRISDLNEVSVAQSESYIDMYFMEKSKKLKVKINRNVNRTEEATEHPHPEGKEPEVPGAAPMPKQTSLKLSSIVEDFLG
jgi:hypothetical protein